MSQGGSMAGSMAGSMGGSMAEVLGATPLTILGAADVPFWENTDNRVDGTPPDIETLTNLAGSVGSPTNGTAAERPHVLSINGKDYCDHTPNQDLRASAISPAIWPALQAVFTVWVTCRFDDITTFRSVLEMGTGTINQGIHFRSTGANAIRFNIFAGGVNTNLNHTFSDTTSVHLFRLMYDGAEMTMHIDGVEGPSPQAKTGTLDNACTQIDLGQSANGAAQFNGPRRETVLYLGIPDATQNSAMTDYMMENAGL